MSHSRRRFLRNGGLFSVSGAARPSWMPRLAFRTADAGSRGDVLVVIFQRGGADGLNMVPPYFEEGNYFGRRPTIAIPAPDSTATSKAYDLDGEFGLHPALAAPDKGNWISWYQEGRLAVVQAMHMDDGPAYTRSHFDAMDYMERGTPGERELDTGWLGRHLATVASASQSPFRGVGSAVMLQASLRGPIPAVAMPSIADFRLQGRQDEIGRFQEHLEELYAGTGWLDLEGQSTFAALDLLLEKVPSGQYSPEHGAQYDTNDAFHRGMMQVAQLVKAEVGLELACVDMGGWDTHANQVDADDPTEGTMAGLMARLATGVTALLTDLRDYEDDPGITVVTMSEFGRRADENGGRGTDHGHGNVMFALGGGINGGHVYTNPWPGLAEEDLARGDDLAGTIEYRDVLGEILVKRLGNAAIDEVFPGHTCNFLGLAETKEIAPPATPTEPPTPTATATATPRPTEEPTRHEVFLPLTRK